MKKRETVDTHPELFVCLSGKTVRRLWVKGEYVPDPSVLTETERKEIRVKVSRLKALLGISGRNLLDRPR